MKLDASLSLAILLYMRYVEDINCVARSIKSTMKFDPITQKMYDEDPDSDPNVLKTEADMMDLLRQIADSVTKMIKWEADWPDKHSDIQIPVLDLKIFIDRQDRGELIKHRFYQKPVKNKSLVSANSGMLHRIVFATLVEEDSRRLCNTSPSLLEEEQKDLIREFNAWLWLMKAEHKETFRMKVTKAAINKNKKRMDYEDKGLRRLYGSREEIAKHKEETKQRRTKDGWYKER